MFTSTSTVFKFWLLCAAVLVSQVHSRTLEGKTQEATTTLRMSGDLGRFGGVEEKFSNSIRKDLLVDVGRWPTGSNLTYRVERGPTRGILKHADIGGIVKLALREWAPHCGLHFTKIHSGEANITIFFDSGTTHLNCPALDRPELVSHSEFQKDTRNVRVCFDDELYWSLFYSPGNLQFYVILLHELGHALGLQHSNTYGSVMYDKYPVPTTELVLPDINLEASTLRNEDVSRMRKLYDIEGTNSDPIFNSTTSIKTWLFKVLTGVYRRNEVIDYLSRKLGFSNNTNESIVEPSSTESSDRPISSTYGTYNKNRFLKAIYDILKE